MLSISLGPLALPATPLLLAAAGWLASRLAARVAGPPDGEKAADAVFHALMLALLAARLGHVAAEFDLYRAQPLAIVDIRDGGWHAAVGWAAGLAWLLWRARRAAALRRALGAGTLAGAALWLGGGLLLGPAEGTPLPAQEFVDLRDGRAVTLKQMAAGRPLVVNLWASWCGPCRQEMPLLAAAQQREGAVAIVFVNQGETAAAVNAYLGSQGLALRDVVLDPGSRLGPAVGSGGLPTTLFYDAAGRPVEAHFGVLNGAALESRLRRLRPRAP